MFINQKWYNINFIFIYIGKKKKEQIKLKYKHNIKVVLLFYFYFLALISYQTTSTSDIPIPWQCEEVINVLAMMSNLIIPGCSTFKQNVSSRPRAVISLVWYVVHGTKQLVFFIVCMRLKYESLGTRVSVVLPPDVSG